MAISSTALFGGLADLVFPRACLLCRLADTSSLTADNLCLACRALIRKERDVEYCPRCGRSVPEFGVTAEGCGSCRGVRLRVSGVARGGHYDGVLGELLRKFKFRGDYELDRCLGVMLGEIVRSAPWCSKVEALVPVPTCWQHRLIRRVHATTAMAPMVANHAGIPLAPVLRRTKGGPHQVNLSYQERVANIRGKFRLRRGGAGGRACLCLIDDVSTSGATLEECAKILHRGGASEVYAAILAKAEPNRPPVLASARGERRG